MSQPRSRNGRIDLLRGISVLLVMLLHFTLTYRLSDSVFATVLTPRFLKALLSNGNYGVTVFFVISGFLITSTSLDRFGSLGDVRLRHFYAFRASRIVPCLMVALAIIVVLGLAGVPSFMNRMRGHDFPPSYFLTVVLSVLTFWHNVLMGAVGYFNYAVNIYWSLSVEEAFYLAFPLLCVALKRKWLILLVWGAAIVLGPIYRSRHADDEIFFMYGYWACFDAIAFGCCAAVLSRRFRLERPWARLLDVAAAALVVVTYLRGISGHEVFGFTLVAFGTALLLLNARQDVSGAPIIRPPAPTWIASRRPLRLAWELPRRALDLVRWFGRHSYELYLFHIIVLGLMREVVKGRDLAYAHKPLWLLLYLVTSALVAGVIARFYSEPANRLLRAALVRSETNGQPLRAA